MKRKQFILGVGCQKGGTSWLHAQLEKSKSVNTGFKKEYHVFDALYVPECKYLLSMLDKRETFVSQKWKLLMHAVRSNTFMDQYPWLLKNTNFRRSIDNYYEYFETLCRNKNITTVCDFTPSYSALPSEIFKIIRDNFENRGVTVKVVFIMRDPIERCWSAVRMKIKNKLKKNPDFNFKQSEQEQLANEYKMKPYEIRTRYECTVANLESVFPKENIYYGFYERLFEDDTLKEMKNFFEIDDFNPNISQKVNVSPKTNSSLDEKLIKEIFEFYRTTYEFCDNRFNIRDIWPVLRNKNLLVPIN